MKFDSGQADDRMLLFATERNFRLLMQSQEWYANGTFKSSPLLFDQLYTTHGVLGNSVMPAVFALLPNKSQDTYERLLAAVKQLMPAAAPQSVLTDFEPAALNAFRNEYPNVVHRGCFFHFSQCIYRNLQILLYRCDCCLL